MKNILLICLTLFFCNSCITINATYSSLSKKQKIRYAPQALSTFDLNGLSKKILYKIDLDEVEKIIDNSQFDSLVIFIGQLACISNGKCLKELNNIVDSKTKYLRISTDEWGHIRDVYPLQYYSQNNYTFITDEPEHNKNLQATLEKVYLKYGLIKSGEYYSPVLITVNKNKELNVKSI